MRYLSLVVLLLVTLAGCQAARPLAATPSATETAIPSADGRPGDFSVAYHWENGSLPPPNHYEYTIMIEADGSGQMTLIPDYPGGDVPVWEERFTLSAAQLDALYATLQAHGLMTTDWHQQNPPPGSVLYQMSVTTGGQQVGFTAVVGEDQEEAARVIMDAVYTAVPEEVRSKLQAQRLEYIENYGS